MLAFLVEGLATRGHEVILWAHPDSRTPAALVPYGGPAHVSRAARARELAQVSTGLLARRRQPVDDVQKNALLGEALAFLMPIAWEEPLSIVMAEALACGTPVIGTRRGSVPEVVRDGETGFVCDTPEAMAEAVGRVSRLSRRACRADAAARFSDRAIVDAYEALYYEYLERLGT